MEHAGGRRTVPLPIALLAPLLAAAGVVLVALLVTDVLGPGASRAEAGGQNRAVVVVDTGSSVRAACVLFSESSISGAEALSRAGMAPIFQGFSGLGSGVCSLNGVGCPSDGSCLTCQAPDYWQYWRSSGGGFSYSNAGASSTAVTDGSIEGWSWGAARRSPPVRSVDSVCGPQAPPPTSPPTTPPPPSGGGGGTGGANDPGGGGPAVAGGPDATTPNGQPAPDASTTTSSPSDTTTTTDAARAVDGASTAEPTDDARDGEQAASLIQDEDGGSVAGSVGLATVAFAAVGFFVWRARRRNHLAAASGAGLDGEDEGVPLERLDDAGSQDPTAPGGG